MALDRFTALPRRSRNVLTTLAARHRADAMDSARFALGAWARAVQAVWSERTDIAEFLRSGNEELGYDLRRRFGLGAPLGTAHPIPSDLFQGSDSPPQSDPAIIILPVYNAAKDVARLLDVLPLPTNELQRIVIVDDGSTDPDIPPLLHGFAARSCAVSLITQPKNLGFVSAVNAGLALRQPDEHAILLNSDTLPPKGWVPRLLAPFTQDSSVASATPLSNAAEILSIPAPGIANGTDIKMVRNLDRIARRLRTTPVDLPTGIGFCLALNRQFLNLIGNFDPAFGRGYGEEVDWCRKTIKLGGRHVVTTNLFVGHQGNASFGPSARKAGIARASRRIAKRYPDYPQEALDWESRDPVAPQRLALALGWLGHVTQEETPIYIAHSLGGGAETALDAEIGAKLAAGSPATVVLRVGGPAAWRVELRGARFALAGDVEAFDLLEKLLEPVERREIIYSCGVHARDPTALPTAITRLARNRRLSMRLHDFYPISPSWNLLGSDGRFWGIPPVDTGDTAHALRKTRFHKAMSHRDWRREWSNVISAADEIVAFSPSSKTLLSEAYPAASAKTVVRPHVPRNLPGPIGPGGRCIGVLGGINLAKGGAVLERLARCSERPIAVIGEMDGRFHLPPPHGVHGRYEQQDIAALGRHYDIGLWLIPSICPETFSFATHEALATGLPVACFNMGAQAEAARAARNGHVLTSCPEDASALAAELEALFRP